MRHGDPTPFTLEAPAVAHLRAAWCLAGWPYQAADETARDVVARALQRAGAVRPSWKEAHDIEIAEDAECASCRGPLYGRESAFCSDACHDRYYIEKRSAAKAAVRNGMLCHHCGAPLNAHRKSRMFCNVACLEAHRKTVRAMARAGKTCRNCGLPFEAQRRDRAFCSQFCKGQWRHRMKVAGIGPRRVRAASAEATE